MQQREIGMQEITFAKGNEQHLKDCRAALCQSTLGERYFSSPGSAEIAILEVFFFAGKRGNRDS